MSTLGGAGRGERGARLLAAGAALLVFVHAPSSWADESSATPPPRLPPVPRAELSPRVPTPQWDLGLLLGACGLGRDSFWEETYFCGGVTGDVTFLREREKEAGLGVYGSFFTVGFADTRSTVGLVGVVPLGSWLVADLGAGPYLHTDGSGASPGVEARLGLGPRVLNPTSHYGHFHALVLGVQHTPGDHSRASTTLSINFRLDAFWFALPLLALL